MEISCLPKVQLQYDIMQHFSVVAKRHISKFSYKSLYETPKYFLWKENIF